MTQASVKAALIQSGAAVILTIMAMATPAFAQGPIPPVRPPEGFQAERDGYDMMTAYQRWRMWIEAQKAPVIEAALTEAGVVEGRHRVGRPLFTVIFNNDFGRFAGGDVRVYCTIMPVYPDRDRGECSYLYRRADVPIAVSYGQEPNAFDLWMRENFDPALVVRNLRAAGAAPGDDLWRFREEMFAGAPSPAAMLAANQRVVRVDSRDCPALKTAIEAVERRRLDWTLDLLAVGEDTPPTPPGPHAVTAEFTLNAWVEGRGLTLGGPSLWPILGPVLDAAHACEQAQARRPS